jgi:selenocysteine lyase/cysteine desulfurase
MTTSSTKGKVAVGGVAAAAGAGADAIKFQTHFPEQEMLRGGATAAYVGESLFDLLTRTALSREAHARLQKLAREKGITLFVDGAHAFAHFPFLRDDLDVDYYGTSLHKWLHAPIGTGFLYVRRDKIKSLWPLMAGSVEQEGDIRKYEEIGTHPAANHNAIAVALAFHRSIGAERKIARLRFLRDRWAKRVVAESGGRARMLTPIGPNESGAIGVIAIDGLEMDKLRGWLLGKHKVVTTALIHEEFKGLRVTPNVYTTLDEVDRFAELMITAIKSGVA